MYFRFGKNTFVYVVVEIKFVSFLNIFFKLKASCWTCFKT